MMPLAERKSNVNVSIDFSREEEKRISHRASSLSLIPSSSNFFGDSFEDKIRRLIMFFHLIEELSVQGSPSTDRCFFICDRSYIGISSLSLSIR
jgi:hypothetical protein